MSRLQADEEGDDRDIPLLAGATGDEEVSALVERVLQRYLGPSAADVPLLCGKCIAELHRKYVAGQIAVQDLEPIVLKMYGSLSYPSWLVMLSRNCEYATDAEVFVKHFENEFAYIAKLWSNSASVEEFMSRYDRSVSDSHDVGRS
jgi:hypothetical protein